jgi:hypothetical protein
MTTTTNTDQLSDTIQSLKDSAEGAIQSQTLEQFEALETYVADVESYVREVQQAMWAEEAKQTLRKLDKNDTLEACDLDLLRVFLISDAERYLAVENNFADWIAELRRLMDDLVRRMATVDRHTIADVRGVLKDASRLVPDIRNFLDEKQRVAKFESAVMHLDAASRKMLAKLLAEQITSSKR